MIATDYQVHNLSLNMSTVLILILYAKDPYIEGHDGISVRSVDLTQGCDRFSALGFFQNGKA